MILVTGNLELERVFRCERLPEPCSCACSSVAPQIGGSGGSLALAICRAGCEVALAAAVGDDSDARLLRGLASETGLKMVLSVYRDAPTGSSAVFLDDAGRYFRSEAMAANALFEVGEDVGRLMDGVGLLLCASDGNARSTEALMRLARSRRVGVALFVSGTDVGPSLKILAPLADLLILSDNDFSEIVRGADLSGMGDFTGEQLHLLPDAKLNALCRVSISGDAAILLGARGVFVSRRDGSHKLVGGEGVTIGRGARRLVTETFAGRLCAEIFRGADLLSAVRASVSSLKPVQ